MNIRIYKYNNYYNRQVKIMTESSPEFGDYIYATPTTVNWNPNDGVIAEAVFGNAASAYYGTGDYLVALNKYNQIESRWFILDEKREKGGQFTLTLRRDLMVDFHDDILNAPLFVEKSTLPVSNPLIFNNENMTYNQILKEQTLLKDEIGCPWIVGYVPRNFASTENKTITAKLISSSSADYTTGDKAKLIKDLTGLTLTGNTTNTISGPPRDDTYVVVRGTYKITAAFGAQGSQRREDKFFLKKLTREVVRYNGGSLIALGFKYTADDSGGGKYVTFTENFQKENNAENIINTIISSYNTSTYEKENLLLSLNNKVIYDTSINKGYKIVVNKNEETVFDNYINSSNNPALYQTLLNNLNFSSGYSNTPATTSFSLYYIATTYSLTLEEFASEIQTTIRKDRDHLVDAPYDMFCIPYGSIDIEFSNGAGGTIKGKTQPETALAIALNIGNSIGSEAIYDVQLLPYCPIRHLIKDGGIYAPDTTAFSWIIVSGTTNIVNLLFWARSSSFNFDIPFKINVPTNPIDFKVENECSFYRICSPNYSGIFDFSATKNYGINYIHVDCQYKPFNPFIHLKPNFSNLYGINPEKDVRGLICGGDFSLPQSSSYWANYELQNKNYQEIFNRQVENLEINNSVQSSRDVMNAVTGSINGAVKGAMMGSKGGVAGIAAGVIAGGAMGTATGILNYQLNEQLRDEALDYTKDLYGYSLGNIQARPNTLSKTSAINNTNKLFPFIEYYSCTDTEKEALRNKIKYNGMTVMAVGKLSDYIGTFIKGYNYIKGKLIRLETIADNSHIVNEIANELNKGVFYENIY